LSSSAASSTPCAAIEVQNGLVERNAGVPPERRIEFRVGIHLGDVVEEADGDLMGDGVNIAARLEGIAAPGAICLSGDAYRQVKGRLDLAASDLGPNALKNIAEPIRVYSLDVTRIAPQRAVAVEQLRMQPADAVFELAPGCRGGAELGAPNDSPDRPGLPRPKPGWQTAAAAARACG
jgi:hypothetical protein